MSNVIQFPGNIRTFGGLIASGSVRAGLAEAERRGFTLSRLDTALTNSIDRQFATYFLGLLGSDDEADRRCGAYGIARLLRTTAGTA